MGCMLAAVLWPASLLAVVVAPFAVVAKENEDIFYELGKKWLRIQSSLASFCKVKFRGTFHVSMYYSKIPESFTFYWWIVRVTLSGYFWLFAPNFWEVMGTYKWYFVILWIQVQWWGYHGLVGALLPCVKEFHEQFALTGGRDAKALGTSTQAIARTWKQRATWWSFHYLIFWGKCLLNKVWVKCNIRYNLQYFLADSMFDIFSTYWLYRCSIFLWKRIVLIETASVLLCGHLLYWRILQ